MAPKVASEIGGFTLVPVIVPGQASLPTSATHYLYLRHHEPKLPDPDSSRSLFLANIPVVTTETHLKRFFGTQLAAGRVERVEFPDIPVKKSQRENLESSGSANTAKRGKKRKRGADAETIEAEIERYTLPDTWDRQLHRSGANAVVVFVDKASMEVSFKAAKQAARQNKEIVWGEGIDEEFSVLGMQRYSTHHRLRYPPRTVLLNSINDYMDAYSRLESARAAALARQRSQPDEDGFITVVRGGRNAPAKMEDAKEAGERLKKKHKPLDNFYRFQTRERNKEKQLQLLKGINESRRELDELRKRKGRLRPE